MTKSESIQSFGMPAWVRVASLAGTLAVPFLAVVLVRLLLLLQ